MGAPHHDDGLAVLEQLDEPELSPAPDEADADTGDGPAAETADGSAEPPSGRRGLLRGRPGRPRRRRSRLRKILLASVALLVVLVSIPTGIMLYVGWHLDHNLHRVHGVFNDLPDRPARAAGAAGGAVNILVIGIDQATGVPTTGSDAQASDWVPGQQRSDTMMIVHIDAGRREAEVMSIPRDSWVDVPGHGMNKINAAYSFGGPRLAVETVEHLTGVRIDHLAIVDWDGYKALIDQVGGVNVDIAKTVVDPHNHVTWVAGRHHLDGTQALLYVRQRYGLPGGDLDRVQRQQAVLRELAYDSLHTTMRKNPKQLYDFLDEVTHHLTVDDQWSATDMAKLALSLRDLRSANIKFLTVPVAGFGREGAQSVVYLAAKADHGLFQALHDDLMDNWLSTHWRDLTPDAVD